MFDGIDPGNVGYLSVEVTYVFMGCDIGRLGKSCKHFQRCCWRREKHPAGNCMFKVNNRNTRTRCEICSKLTIKTPERR